MVTIKEAIVVEGRYDAMRLSAVVDTVIVQTGGFRIFRDKEQLSMLKRLAKERGLIVMTDVDAAGFLIRDHICAAVDPALIRHAYIPPRIGKEKRKAAPSKEGLLGVEGMEKEELLIALHNAGATFEDETTTEKPPYMTITRLFEDGLSGTADSKKKRVRLCELLDLPSHLSTSRLMAVLNAAFSEEEYLSALAKL